MASVECTVTTRNAVMLKLPGLYTLCSSHTINHVINMHHKTITLRLTCADIFVGIAVGLVQIASATSVCRVETNAFSV